MTIKKNLSLNLYISKSGISVPLSEVSLSLSSVYYGSAKSSHEKNPGKSLLTSSSWMSSINSSVFTKCLAELIMEIHRIFWCYSTLVKGWSHDNRLTRFVFRVKWHGAWSIIKFSSSMPVELALSSKMSFRFRCIALFCLQ